MYFSKGNRKLSKDVLIWNLPRLTTCPGAGACKDWCYEIKIERMYKNTRPCREQNFKDSKSSRFEYNIARFLRERKEGIVRVHECGDFYSQVYLDKWKWTARRFPKKIFYAYTKSFHLDLWTNLPSNFKILQSYGSKWDHLIDPNRATFKAMPKGIIPNKGEFLCTGGTKGTCGDVCKVCMTYPTAHVIVPMHR